MTDKKQRMIEKIRKLLNRAENPILNEDGADLEADSARELATRLMLQYDIEPLELEGVTVGQGENTDATIIVLAIKRPDNWLLSLGVVLADHFLVKVVYLPRLTQNQAG